MIQLDTTQFQAALREYIEATGKTATEVVNRGMKNTIIQASRATKKSSKVEIQADLERSVAGKDGRSGPRKYLIINARRRKLAGTTEAGAQRWNRQQKLAGVKGRGKFSLKNVGVTKLTKEIKKDVQRMVSARKRTAGYLILCIRMAGKAYGLYQSIKVGRGWAAKSRGTPSSDWRPMTAVSKAEIWLPAGAAAKVDLQSAMNAAAADMLNHAQKKMAEDAAKHSSTTH